MYGMIFALVAGLPRVSPEQLNRLRLSGAAHVIDVNAPRVWAKGHVPGARNLDPKTLASGVLPEDKSTPLVFYCSNVYCWKAPNVARKVKSMGYQNVQVMSAGIDGWLAAGLPTERGSA